MGSCPAGASNTFTRAKELEVGMRLGTVDQLVRLAALSGLAFLFPVRFWPLGKLKPSLVLVDELRVGVWSETSMVGEGEEGESKRFTKYSGVSSTSVKPPKGGWEGIGEVRMYQGIH